MEPYSSPHRSRDELRNEFGSVVREFRAPLIGFLRRYTRDEEAAADLAQETFVKAYFQINRFDDRRPFGPWLVKDLREKWWGAIAGWMEE